MKTSITADKIRVVNTDVHIYAYSCRNVYAYIHRYVYDLA